MRAAGRALVLGAFILVMAITPLAALTSGGVFETWLPSQYKRGPVRVFLHDSTGLVRGIAPALGDGSQRISNAGDNSRVLLLTWSGDCDEYQLNLAYDRGPNGYVIHARGDSVFCSWFTPSPYGTVAISLWAPVDSATVEYVSHHVP